MRTVKGLRMPFALLILFSSLVFAQPDLRESARRMAELEEAVKSLNQQDCTEDNRAFSKINSGITVACEGTATQDGYDEVNIVDCTGDQKTYPGGFIIRASGNHPYLGAKSLYPHGGPPGRMIQFTSRDSSLNETYLYFQDVAGGPDSHDVKSIMFLLPRKVVPSVHTVGDEVQVTMNTGETVIFDKATGAIKSGALREGPIDLTTDRFRRQPPNIHYTGTGISVRLNHRFEDPLQFTETAEVQQGSRSCRVPRTALFESNGKLKTTSDTAFVKALNQNCPTGTGQSPFRI